MDHLDIPPSCQPNATTVPFLGLAPAYDRKGFEGFPERYGFDKDKLLSLRKSSGETWIDGKVFPSDWVESFLQEWLWFGMLHEFELFCGFEMKRNDYIRTDSAGKEFSHIINTTLLLPYVRAAVIDQLRILEVPIDLQVGELVNAKVFDDHDRISAERYGPFEVLESPGDLQFVIGAEGKMTMDVLLLERAMPDRELNNTSVSARQLTTVPIHILSRALLESMRYSSKLTVSELLSGESPNHLWIKKTDSKRLYSCLQEVGRITTLLSAAEEPALRLPVAISIDILCTSLDNASCLLMDKVKGGKPPGTVSAFYLKSFRKQLKSRNWCLARVAEPREDIISLYILSLLPSYESLSHSNCDEIQCLERRNELELLSFKHRSTCDGNCLKVVFDEQRLIDILHDGGIAGVGRIQDYNRLVTYQVINVTDKRYIAISHVWSHGLGNPIENALPSCQIEHLFGLVTAIGGDDVLLWIDTISVPIKPEHNRIAISRLRKVYSEARWVLVLDRHLEQVGNHWLEMLLQVLASEWLTRLWTLQEGRLASALLFQFSHRAISVAELIGTKLYDQDLFSKIQRSLQDRITARFTKQQDPKRQFRSLISDLSHRSVTVSGDEPICIATLLNLKLEDYHPFPTMVDIYRSGVTLPLELLFVGNTRLKDPGLRWAPSSLLKHSMNHFMFSGDRHATLSSAGLLLRADCIFFDHDLDFKLTHEGYGNFCCVRCPGGVSFGFTMRTDILFNFRDYQSAAILMSGDISDSRPMMCKAVLVSDLTEDAGILSGHYRTDLWVMSEATFADEGSLYFMPSLSHLTRHYTTGSFRLKQAFCVD
ncbi:hypothetical protein MMC26_006901 [Xylographa opegraphella]|nr:hypothetical protein [Xylographa opegraphella]